MALVPNLRAASGGNDRQAAVTVAGRSLDLGDLSAAAGAVAARISGLPSVAVEATPSLETVVAVVGALEAGVPVVPIAPDAGPLERTHVLSDCGAPVLLAGAGTAPELPAGGRVEVVPVRASDRAEWRADTGFEVAPTRPAMILYTSGTTGLPKGVMLSEAAIAADLDALAQAWEWGPDDVLVHGLPLFHVHGLVLGVLGALRTGSRLIHTGRPTPAGYAAGAAEGGTLYFGVPTVWSRVAADAEAARALRAARLLVSGSAGLPGPVFEKLSALGRSGTHRAVRHDRDADHAERSRRQPTTGRLGRPAPARIEARLVDDDRQPVVPDGDTVGELEVRGRHPDERLSPSARSDGGALHARWLVANRRRGVRRPSPGGTASWAGSRPT